MKIFKARDEAVTMEERVKDGQSVAVQIGPLDGISLSNACSEAIKKKCSQI